MPQQTSLLNLLNTGATELALNAPTTSPNLQTSNLPTLLAQANTPNIDLGGVTPTIPNLQASKLPTLLALVKTPNIDLGGVTPTIPNLQASNLPTLLAQVKTPNLDLGGVTPPKYIDNQPQ